MNNVAFDEVEDINVTIDSNAVYYGQLEVGTVTTGEAGTEATITNSGSSSRATLNFTIPRGEKGIKGDKGDKGETGDKGEKGDKGDAGAAFTYDMFTASQLASLKGDKGDKGDKGEKGDKGDKGETGATGATGANGKDGSDYVLTTADKQEIANIVLAAIPSAEEVSY